MRDPLAVNNVSDSNSKQATPTLIQLQQITRYDNQQLPKIKYDIQKKFIPSPELIVDSSQSSELNEKFIIPNHHHGASVSTNSLLV